VGNLETVTQRVKVDVRRIIERINEVLRRFEVRLIEAKHEIGVILNEELELVPHGEKLMVLSEIEEEVGWKKTELYRCMKFAELYPDLEDFLATHEGISWRQISDYHLYGVIEEEKPLKSWVCSICGHSFLEVEPIRLRLCADDYQKLKRFLKQA